MQRGFVPILVVSAILATVAVVIVGVSVYRNNNNGGCISQDASFGCLSYSPSLLETSLQNVSPQPSITAYETANWKIYTNEKYSFRILIPQDWIIEEGTVSPFGVSFMPNGFEKNKRDMRLVFDPVSPGRPSVFNKGAGGECQMSTINIAEKKAKECIITRNGEYARYLNVTDLAGINWSNENEVGFYLRKEYIHLAPIYNGIISTLKFLGNSNQVYKSQEECEQNTGKNCSVVNCDYVPQGKTFDEGCGKDFKKGWYPME